MRKQEIPLIFLILQITVMTSPENYCRIMVVGFLMTSLLDCWLLNFIYFKKTKPTQKTLGLKHGNEQDFRVLTITWSTG